MKMFVKKKEDRPKKSRNSGNLSQYGLFDIPSSLAVDDDANDVDEGDSDLEAELAALAEDSGSARRKRPQRKPKPVANLDAMVAASLRDIPSDEEVSDGEDDPDLLGELQEIAGDDVASPPPQAETPTHSTTSLSKLLDERLKMYETAERNAKEAGETSRARRFTRGAKTLKDLIKQVDAGGGINEEDIPPEVSVHVQKQDGVTPPPTADQEPKTSTEAPTTVAEDPQVETPTSTLSADNIELLNLLNTRKGEYKTAALKAKKSGDTSNAMKFIKITKQFDMVINAVENGHPVDLSKMPGPPEESEAPGAPAHETIAAQQPIVPHPAKTEEEQMQTTEEPDEPQELITASSIGEALQQRFELYRKQEEAAKEQGNSSKARRMGRIVKQFEDAIKKHKAGKPIPLDELPTPPGYAPIPVEGETKPKSAPPAPPPRAAPAPPPRATTAPKPAPASPSTSEDVRVPKASSTRADKQLAFLLARQKEFKEAALLAKRKGEMTQAKEFLRSAKGFEPLIKASQGGFPVDIDTLPVPPSTKSQLDDEYDVIMAEETALADDADDGEHADLLARLEQQLTRQLKMCLTTRDHNKTIGDVAGTNRFEQLAYSVTKDLDVVRLAQKTDKQIPKFHYETKNFAIVQSCTDLNDHDLEMQIVRGISYNCSNPNDIDTYVKFDFAYPQEAPVSNRTATIKGTNNPEYNERVILPIQRTSKSCQRYFKRHGVKFEVYARGGFFRGDSLLGTVHVKLQHLETQCELHDSYDLMDGRKKAGGKLEVKFRVRDPILTRQVEQLSEKWLVLDH